MLKQRSRSNEAAARWKRHGLSKPDAADVLFVNRVTNNFLAYKPAVALFPVNETYFFIPIP